MPESRIISRSSHQLINIMTIAVLAVLCGADGWVAVETYGKAKQDWLAKFLDLSHGIPSHDTFGRVFSKIDPEKMEHHFQEWVKLMAGKLGLTVVAIDGKSLNGSYDRENSLNALQMVSAWSSNQGLVLGQCAVDKKSNEITAIPILLEQLRPQRSDCDHGCHGDSKDNCSANQGSKGRLYFGTQGKSSNPQQ